MGNKTHTLNANQIQTPTQYVKAAASSLCNKYCKAYLVSFFFYFFFFQVKYNNQYPKPCFLHSEQRRLMIGAEHLQPIKEKTTFPLASQSQSFSSLSSQLGLFTFLRKRPK